MNGRCIRNWVRTRTAERPGERSDDAGNSTADLARLVRRSPRSNVPRWHPGRIRRGCLGRIRRRFPGTKIHQRHLRSRRNTDPRLPRDNTISHIHDTRVSTDFGDSRDRNSGRNRLRLRRAHGNLQRAGTAMRIVTAEADPLGQNERDDPVTHSCIQHSIGIGTILRCDGHRIGNTVENVRRGRRLPRQIGRRRQGKQTVGADARGMIVSRRNTPLVDDQVGNAIEICLRKGTLGEQTGVIRNSATRGVTLEQIAKRNQIDRRETRDRSDNTHDATDVIEPQRTHRTRRREESTIADTDRRQMAQTLVANVPQISQHIAQIGDDMCRQTRVTRKTRRRIAKHPSTRHGNERCPRKRKASVGKSDECIMRCGQRYDSTPDGVREEIGRRNATPKVRVDERSGRHKLIESDRRTPTKTQRKPNEIGEDRHRIGANARIGNQPLQLEYGSGDERRHREEKSIDIAARENRKRTRDTTATTHETALRRTHQQIHHVQMTRKQRDGLPRQHTPRGEQSAESDPVEKRSQGVVERELHGRERPVKCTPKRRLASTQIGSGSGHQGIVAWSVRHRRRESGPTQTTEQRNLRLERKRPPRIGCERTTSRIVQEAPPR